MVGRGSTAIYVALRAIERKVGTGEVIVPSLSCTSPAKAVYYAGFKPVFADVNLSDLTIDIDSLNGRITEETRAILPIHIFGHAACMDGILEIARNSGLYVIEDAAQAIGGRFKNRRIGSMGDFSILSFGESKVLDAGEGGAILTDSGDLAAIAREEIDKLEDHKKDFYDYALRIKAQSYRDLNHALIGLLRLKDERLAHSVFTEVLGYFRDVYLFKFRENQEVLERIVGGFEDLDEANHRRVQRADLYSRLLASDGIVHPRNWRESGVVWRYCMLTRTPRSAKAVTDGLRRNGFHASNLYWPVDGLFYGENFNSTGTYIGARIVNLWVDEQATDAYIRSSCAVILNQLAEGESE